jgi:hypothetical protein
MNLSTLIRSHLYNFHYAEEKSMPSLALAASQGQKETKTYILVQKGESMGSSEDWDSVGWLGTLSCR